MISLMISFLDLSSLSVLRYSSPINISVSMEAAFNFGLSSEKPFFLNSLMTFAGRFADSGLKIIPE